MSLRLAAVGLIVAAATLTAPNAQASDDCRFTQGYWQNHAQNAGDTTAEVWLALRGDPFYRSALIYDQVLLVPPAGNSYWILAHQVVAAEANYLNGADNGGIVATTMASASQLLSSYTPEQITVLPKSSSLRQEFVELARILDDWNNGLIGSGYCGDIDNGGGNGGNGGG